MSFYHYTSIDGFFGMSGSGQINMANNQAFGPGIYGTALGPETPGQVIAYNNYGPNLGQQRFEQGMTSVCIPLNVPYHHANTQRDVLVAQGPIDFYSSEVGRITGRLDANNTFSYDPSIYQNATPIPGSRSVTGTRRMR